MLEQKQGAALKIFRFQVDVPVFCTDRVRANARRIRLIIVQQVSQMREVFLCIILEQVIQRLVGFA